MRRGERVDITRGVVRWIVKSIVFGTVLGLVLFLCAGRTGWGMGWTYLGIYVLNQVLLALILPRELLAERSRAQEGTKTWDLLLSILVALVLPMGIYALSGLDQRYGWTGGLSPTLVGIALVIMLTGTALTSWAMTANRFFSGTVRIQEDRRQRVATGGPYRWVRHPGYLGGILHHAAAPLVLGSLWALIPGLLGVAALVLRTVLEDRTLRKELHGYARYAQRTRYRLLPGVW